MLNINLCCTVVYLSLIWLISYWYRYCELNRYGNIHNTCLSFSPPTLGSQSEMDKPETPVFMSVSSMSSTSSYAVTPKTPITPLRALISSPHMKRKVCKQTLPSPSPSRLTELHGQTRDTSLHVCIIDVSPQALISSPEENGNTSLDYPPSPRSPSRPYHYIVRIINL